MNLALWLHRAGVRRPSDIGVKQEGSPDRTYDQLSERVARIGGWFSDQGLLVGDRVAILQDNCIELVESLYACFHSGLVAVPINARLTVREVEAILDDAQPRGVVYDPAHSLHALSGDFPRALLCTEDDGVGIPIETAARSGSMHSPADTVGSTDPAWLFYTSGTTGKPKGATLTHGNLAAMASAFLAEISPLDHSSVVYHCAPLTHGSGLYAIPAIGAGATQVLSASGSFSPENVLEDLDRHAVSDLAFAAPTMLNRLVAEIDRVGPTASGLRNLTYGGAPMYVDDLESALQTMGPVFTQIYGQAEAPVTISRLTREDHLSALERGDRQALSSAGYAFLNAEVAVRLDSGDIAFAGEGEIVTRGPAVMRGYWNDPEATDQALRDGWLHTGDLGVVESSGMVRLLDRNKDLVITGGANVYPREVEDVLLIHPGVEQAAVLGIPDRDWGERVVAVVVRREGTAVSEAELDTWCRGRLAGYKIPRRYEWATELPTSSYGKILKRELRDLYTCAEEKSE